MASCGALDAIASTKVCWSCGLGSTRSPSNVRAQRKTIDHVRENQTLKIKSRFRRLWSDMWTHQDLMGYLWDRGMVVHDDRAIAAVDPSSPNHAAHIF